MFIVIFYYIIAMDSFLEKILKYQYPTKEELIEIKDRSPKLQRFGFKDQWNNKSIKENLINGSTEKYNKLSHLHEWDKLLENKIGDLQTAYVYVLTHFNRGVPETVNEYIKNVSIRPNYDNLIFYFTYLHYIIVSVIDNILQIINIYYDLGLQEYEVNKNSVVKKLKTLNLDNLVIDVENFFNDFFKYSNLRNAIAHRFSPYFLDQRSKLDEKECQKKITLGGNNDFQDFKHEIVQVEEAFGRLRSFMGKLRTEFGI